MFEPLPQDFDFPTAEKRVLEFWKQHDIFGASLRLRAGSPRFVFYEGPPTANGLPHPGHCLTRAIKDIFPRYRTMTGHLVERKAGWDTHGLPVEREVCKELGIHTKQEIEKFGVEPFVRKCIDSVFRYTREWEEMTRRLGFWVNLDEAYATYHQSYVESVWWSLKTLFERGLLYQGHKVVWWWAQGGTALSSGEVGEGYRQVDDPSVFVKFALVGEGTEARRDKGTEGRRDEGTEGRRDEGTEGRRDEGTEGRKGEGTEGRRDEGTEGRKGEGTEGRRDGGGRRVSLLVWTTTPWTLISNHFAAVNPELEYALVEDPGAEGAEPEFLYIAAALVEQIAKKVKRELRVVSSCKGAELIGRRYLPPFDGYYQSRPEPTAFDLPDEQRQADLPLGERMAALKAGGVNSIGWRVTAGDFVTTESGTGLVHEAPAFGEVDFNLLQEERGRFANPMALPVLCAVHPDGTFDQHAPERYRGRWIKDCDKEIIRELRDERKTPWGTPLLYHQEQYRHDYPFCPQAPDDPLIQYARKGWFVRTSEFKDEFLANNDKINWLPEHIKEGRFGDFLRNNVDWALSRERYWGTPLPIWVCEKTGKMEAIGSFEELKAKPGATDGGYWVAKKKADAALPDHLQVHKPYIDEWTYESPFDGEGTEARGHEGTKGTARMRRVAEVIDCWWDAGSMPYAQWGFPHQAGSVEKLAQRFPADFISEALDQTRGWFYGLLSISTLLFGPRASADDAKSQSSKSQISNLKSQTSDSRSQKSDLGSETSDLKVQTSGLKGTYPLPFRNCIVLGMVLGEDGLKMSKRTKNYREPTYIFDTLGADAMRWYFFSAQAPWTTIRFQEANIRDAQREFLVRLYNVLSFFNIYANIDGFVAIPAPEYGHRPTAQRSELDRWIISELQRTIKFVRESMDRFENFPAARRLSEFVDALSNWYVRRSRDRFWRPVSRVGTARHSVGAATSDKEVGSAHPTGTPADQDKWDAYHTLYGCLYTLSTMIAPFTPFFAETMYQNLRGTKARSDGGTEGEGSGRTRVVGTEARRDGGTEGEGKTAKAASGADALPVSVHLCDYPVVDEALIDVELAVEMELVREIVSLGRSARTSAKLKVRQPLSRVEIILSRKEHAGWLDSHRALIAEELNVKLVEFTSEADHYVSYQIKPDFKALGPKFGKLAPKIGAALPKLDAAEAKRALATAGEIALMVDGETVKLTESEVQVRLEAKPGWSAAQGRVGVVVISTELTPELAEEGVVRELVHHLQAKRKDLDLAYEAKIKLGIVSSDAFAAIVRKFADTLKSECLVSEVIFGPPAAGVELVRVEIEEHIVEFAIE